MKRFLTVLSTSLLIVLNNQNYANNIVESDICYDTQSDTICFNDSYSYFTLGTGPILLIPSVGIGHRSHTMHNGYDLSLNLSTIGYFHQLQGGVIYHRYPNPYREDPWYYGIGPVGTLWFSNEKYKPGFTIGLDFVVGKEFITKSGDKHFFEYHIQEATLAIDGRWNKSSVIYFPLMYLRYGVAF